jgi:glycosyltransferase involved in cell wall biosynthesis
VTRTARIALVVPDLASGGGVPVVARFLYRALAATGRYEPELISLAIGSRDPQSVRLLAPASWAGGVRVRPGTWEGLSFRHVGCTLAEIETWRYRPRRALTRLLDGYDVVQVVAGWPSWALVARAARPPLGLQVATLATAERHELLARTRGLLRPWRRLMTRVLARMDDAALARADAVFVENTWMLEHVRRRIGAERVRFAPPGVDTDRFHPAPVREVDGPILGVGRFSDPRKKVDLLFRAYALLRARRPAAPALVLAGRGPAPRDLELARDLGLADHVRVVEGLADDELAALYRRAGLFVLSSDEEGLGLVILEAMASGIPVVATDCGGPSTSVVPGDTGWIVPRGDPQALCDAMARVLDDPERAARMGAAGRQRAVDRFSLAATAAPFLDWYDRVAWRAIL